jgi:hypothetical protein
MHGAAPDPASPEQRRPLGHIGQRCGADVDAEQPSAGIKVLDQSPARRRKAIRWARCDGVADVDDEYVTAARLGQPRLDVFRDVGRMTKVMQDFGDAAGCLREAMPWVRVGSGPADDQDVSQCERPP